MAAVFKSLASILFSYETVPLSLLRRQGSVDGQLDVQRRNEPEKVTCPTFMQLLESSGDVPICPGLSLVHGEEAAYSENSTRSVRFDLTKNEVHEIIPYSEVYNGVHPRDFQFGKGLPAPAACFYDPNILPHPVLSKRGWFNSPDESSDSEDEIVSLSESAGLQQLLQVPVQKLRSLPPPVLSTLVLLCVFIRMFGVQVLTDIVMPESTAECSPSF